jgi:hypothetical protein
VRGPSVPIDSRTLSQSQTPVSKPPSLPAAPCPSELVSRSTLLRLRPRRERESTPTCSRPSMSWPPSSGWGQRRRNVSAAALLFLHLLLLFSAPGTALHSHSHTRGRTAHHTEPEAYVLCTLAPPSCAGAHAMRSAGTCTPARGVAPPPTTEQDGYSWSWWDPAATAARRGLVGPGSSPPTCRSRCGGCHPCRPVHVAIQPGRSFPLEYYPEAWRCKCGNKLFMP